MQHHSTNKTYSLCDPDLLPSAGTCYVCNCIRRLFVEDEVDIVLGDAWEGKGTPCDAHDALLSWFEGTFCEEVQYLASLGASRTLDRGFHSVGFWREIGSSPKIEMIDYKKRPRRSRSISLIQVSDETQTNSSEKSFDPEWIDLPVAREWLGYCVKTHGTRCRNDFKSFSCAPAYLVDTELDCIVEGTPGLEYVALSYRWGTRDSFRTKKCNFDSLTVRRGITKETNIPHTIKHAMHIVRSLGERYLWVDSLCIKCDDEEHFQGQLQIMGSIYACAKLTIVSADGDAWDGLHGIRNVSQPRTLPNIFSWLNGTKLVIRDLPALSASHSSYEPGSTSEYFRRGWTFQEYFLSPRRLIFGKRQIHWSCACAMFHEDRPDEKRHLDDSTPWHSLGVPNILSGIPDFDELERLLNECHMRHFTRPEDALPGITGLLNLLKQSFKGGFLCGLPQMRFEAALMWHCALGANILSGDNVKTFLEARKHSMSHGSALPGAILPSWSWVSWRGNNLRLLDEEEDYQLPKRLIDAKLGSKYITAPITTWYSHDTPFSNNKRRIDSFSDCKNYSRSPEFVAQGWIEESCDLTKHFEDSANIASEEDKRVIAHKYVYHHPGLPNKLFWRPFSIPTFEQHDEHADAHELQQCQYISCRAQRRWFHARRLTAKDMFGTSFAKPEYVFDVSFDAQIIVVDDLDRTCGWLQTSSEPTASEFRDASYGSLGLGSSLQVSDDPNPTVGNPLPRRKVELVAVCHRKKSFISGVKDLLEKTRKEFYGVLWVEWDDRVAYRMGCGYIEKGVWDQSGTEEVDLVLG